jgi:hypothetical protein
MISKPLRLVCCTTTLIAAWLATGVAARAETGGDFRPYVPPAAEQVSAPLLVLLAYAALWLVLLLFVASIWRRQQRLEAELAELLRRAEVPR